MIKSIIISYSFSCSVTYTIIGYEVSDSVAIGHTHSTDDQLKLQETQSVKVQGN